MPDKHAVLSASSCYRWLACPPSAKECAKLPDTSSEFARQNGCPYALRIQGKDGSGPKAGRPDEGTHIL